MFCRMKRQVPSLFTTAPAPADQKKENKKENKKEKKEADSGSGSSGGGRGFISRALRACARRRRPGGSSRGRGLQVASDERLGPADRDDPPTAAAAAAAETEKQWLVEQRDSSDGPLDPEGWGLVRAAAPPAHYA